MGSNGATQKTRGGSVKQLPWSTGDMTEGSRGVRGLRRQPSQDCRSYRSPRRGACSPRRSVLVSATVKDLVAGSALSFQDRGIHSLKGVPGDWRLFAVDR